MSVEKHSTALKQDRLFGLHAQSRHAVLEDLARAPHYLRPPPGLDTAHNETGKDPDALDYAPGNQENSTRTPGSPSPQLQRSLSCLTNAKPRPLKLWASRGCAGNC